MLAALSIFADRHRDVVESIDINPFIVRPNGAAGVDALIVLSWPFPQFKTQNSHLEEEGLPVQREHCGHLVGYFTSETDGLNQVAQIWADTSADERDRRRAALWADPLFAATLSAPQRAADREARRKAGSLSVLANSNPPAVP